MEATMKKQAVRTAAAPQALGPYSQAMRWGNLLFLSGQVGIDPQTNMLVDGGVEAQTRQVLKNMTAILAAVGLDFSCLLKTTVYLKDMADFKTINEIYADHMPDPYPARSALAVKELPLGAEVEIEAIALIEK
jgi:2-iminobutanoate/2-iminopropanoate deaminase